MHNQVDVAFVVDSTSSMGNFISDAKRRMELVLTTLSKAADVDIRVVLIDYRDHPPQDNTYASKCQTGKVPVTVPSFARALADLSVHGGGDAAESVLDGVDELTTIEWRPHSRRIAFLVGDAPGHGGYGKNYAGNDTWQSGCPCGRTPMEVSARLESCGVLLYGITVNMDPNTRDFFGSVARLTGGRVFTQGGVTEVESLLKAEFGLVDVDKQVLDVITKDPNWSIGSVMSALDMLSGDVDGSVRRLIGRDLVSAPA